MASSQNHHSAGKVPDQKDWIALADVAKMCNRTVSTVTKYCTRGLQNAGGETVKLKRWKTISGWVTTAQAIQEFQNELNSQ